MKKWVVTAVITATVTVLYANPAAERSEESMQAYKAKMLQRVQAELGLNDQQAKQWGEIQQHYMQEHMKLRTKQNEEINALLTKEQQVKFEKMQQRFRQRLNHRMGAN